jgi:L-alanine-DL-glutamate epimerase-like enolase superfamily enzyme
LKIARHEILSADAGIFNTHFLKVTTDDGAVGWSEFGEHTGTRGVSAVLAQLCDLVVGWNALEIERIIAFLRGKTFQAPGGVNQHAVSAIVNALLDIKGKALGIPVHALLGGPVRHRIPFYWSHCGQYRILHSELMRKPRLQSFEDAAALGAEARARGVKALKTGTVRLVDGRLVSFTQGFSNAPGFAELNLEAEDLRANVRYMEAFREGAGPDVQLMLDINCNFRTEGVIRLVRALRHLDLLWFECDINDPRAMAVIRSAASFPLASLEAVYGRTGMRPYLEAGAVDIAIVDPIWNGYLEALKMADLAAAHDLNIAPHCYTFGGLGDYTAMHFAAAVPNLRIMEFDLDEAPWKWEFVGRPPPFEDGEILVPDRPGWGVEIDERAVRAHPPR